MATLHPASKIVPATLGPLTPLGFFRSLDPHSNASEFLIVERNGVRSAIILKASQPKWIFEAFPLTDGDNAWTGVSLGAVEVLVDIEVGQFSPTPLFGRGAITITGGKVYISAVPSGRLGNRVAFEIGETEGSDETVSALFGRWQLIQRDHTGIPILLYELT